RSSPETSLPPEPPRASARQPGRSSSPATWFARRSYRSECSRIRSRRKPDGFWIADCRDRWEYPNPSFSIPQSKIENPKSRIQNLDSCRGGSMTAFRKLMVANRGEIAIRVFRSAHELGIRTMAVYSHEDRFALHRLKADEAYQVGKAGEPIRSYLDIPAIVGLAQEKQVDAIFLGYGFPSENAEFARACAQAGNAGTVEFLVD